MWIEPNTTISILNNVPLDNTYRNTIYFASEGERLEYFTSKTKHLLTKQSYQRMNRGYMRVNLPVEELYDCNYLYFVNLDFSAVPKYVYCFITSVDYINNNVSEIHYEIDVIQTWDSNYQLQQCFVERQHTESDKLYEHIVPEDLMLGDNYGYRLEESVDFHSFKIVTVLSDSFNSETQLLDGTIIDGVYTPLQYDISPTLIDTKQSDTQTQIDAVNAYMVNNFYRAKRSDDIVAMYQLPDYRSDYGESKPIRVKLRTAIGMDLNENNNYKPKNNKLFNYPYNFITCSNNQGQKIDYKCENFISASSTSFTEATFFVTGSDTPTPVIKIKPFFYNGYGTGTEYALALTEFPMVQWLRDAYLDYNIQQSNSTAMSFISTAVNGLFSAINSLTGASKNDKTEGRLNFAESVINTGIEIGNKVARIEDLQSLPDAVLGSANSTQYSIRYGELGFTFYSVQVKPQIAKIIDDYFTRYGYAIKENKIPNRAARPHWTYVKTLGCTITGSIPADDMRTICGIYDRGITFWRKGEEVGNYSLDNSPQT